MVKRHLGMNPKIAAVLCAVAFWPLLIWRSPAVQAQAIYDRERGLEVLRRNRCGAAEYLEIYSSGLQQYQRGQFRLALETFQSYQRLAQKFPCDDDGEQEIIGLNRLGLVHESLGQYEQAREAFQQAQQINQNNEDDSKNLLQGIILNNLGLVLAKLGQHQSSLDAFQEAVDLHAEEEALADQGTSYTGLGLAYFELGQYVKALEAYEQALLAFRREDLPVAEATALNGIGNVQTRLGRHGSAMTAFQQAIAIFNDSEALALEGLTRSDRGYALIAAGQLAEAEAELRQAIDILDSLREDLDDSSQISIFETQAAAYRRLQMALIAQGKPKAALEISERGRARAFVSQLSQRLNEQDRSPSEDGESNYSASTETRSAPPSTASVEPRSATPSAASTETRSAPPSAALTSQPPDLATIQQIASDKDATLVSYAIGETTDRTIKLYIWVVQPTGEVSFEQVDLSTDFLDQLTRQAPLSQLETAFSRGTFQDTAPLEQTDSQGEAVIGRYVRGVILEPIADVTPKLQHLYQLLIQPIEDHLPTDPNQRVVFVPQGGLFLLPFPALQDGNGKYLIEKHTILTAPSIQVLGLTDALQAQPEQTASGPSSPEDFLVVGNPDMPALPEMNLVDLPGAEREAIDIARLLNTEPLIGREATEVTVSSRMPDARIIHLATHGLLEYGRPEDSGVRDLPGAIVLAADDQGDGLLTSAEIFDLDLKADLVVLSACDTGRGRLTGDGVVGLSRSLIIAGVPSVVVSLWSVPDAPTAELMVEFYQQLENQPDKAQALRQAMLTTLQRHPHPKDWAAFTLVGAAE